MKACVKCIYILYVATSRDMWSLCVILVDREILFWKKNEIYIINMDEIRFDYVIERVERCSTFFEISETSVCNPRSWIA